MIMASKEVLSL